MEKNKKSQKIEQEVIDNFKNLQLNINNAIRSLGEVTYELETLQSQKSKVLQEISTLRQQSEKALKDFEEANGPGTLNLESGTFEPTP